MPDITLDLSNLNLEFEVIAHSIQKGMLPEGVEPNIFAGQKSNWIARKLATLGPPASISLILAELQREGRDNETEEFESLLTRLQTQRVIETTIPDAVKRLKELAMGRKLALILSKQDGIAEKLKDHKITEAFSDLQNFLFAETTMRDVISEGSLIASEQEILADIEASRQMEEFRGCKTYISELDEAIQGLLPGEVGLFVGASGEGKSIALLDIGMRNWEMGQKNVLGFTIEMKRREQEFRQISWATGIDSFQFRSGEFSEEEMDRIKRFFVERRTRENIFYWIDIPENINAAQIERKIIQTERKTGKVFDLILIDYMQIMSPIGRFNARVDWDAQAEISWNVHNLARRTEKAIWSAAQKKENLSDKERQKGGLKSIGLSYLVAQPVDIVAVLLENLLAGFIEINIAKGRSVRKTRIKLRPDFRYAHLKRFEDPIGSREGEGRPPESGA